MPTQVIFEDGFPCDPASPNFAAHEEISEDLRHCAALWSKNVPTQMLFPKCAGMFGDRSNWLPAAAERFDWHMRNGDRQWHAYLRALLRMLLSYDTVLDQNTLRFLATGTAFAGQRGDA